MVIESTSSSTTSTTTTTMTTTTTGPQQFTDSVTYPETTNQPPSGITESAGWMGWVEDIG